ncbi:MAG: RluA family pseudouridine synthase [Rhodospirillaceae bacterium]
MTGIPSDGADGAAALLTCVVPAGAAGERLDKMLAAAFRDLSRSRLQALLEQGHVGSGGRTITDPAHRVKPGQVFDVVVPPPEPALPEPQALPLSIVYEDGDVLVLDKAAGMVVHPAPGNRDLTLVNALLAHCGDSLSGIGGVCRPGIVHRLDKDTSGLLVVAKSDRAHAGLSAQFGDRTIRRTYAAVVWGLPSPTAGTVSGAIGRSHADRKKMAVVTAGGRAAVTHYRVLRGFGLTAALVECRLETGRTHQIRVHLASIGHPVLGDAVYGGGPTPARLKRLPEAARPALAGFPRQALHARRLEFLHPVDGHPLVFEVELPADMKLLIAALGEI